jgi:hypothetical protein
MRDGTCYVFWRKTVEQHGTIYGQDVRPLLMTEAEPSADSCEGLRRWIRNSIGRRACAAGRRPDEAIATRAFQRPTLRPLPTAEGRLAIGQVEA